MSDTAKSDRETDDVLGADFAESLGQAVTVEGVRARDGSLAAYMQKITLPNGTSLEFIQVYRDRWSQAMNDDHHLKR